MTIFQSILLGFLVVCAISVSFSRNLLNSILIYMSYSLIMSILWVCLESPDLAITEAAVGAGVTSILFFATLKKIQAIRIENEKTAETVPENVGQAAQTLRESSEATLQDIAEKDTDAAQTDKQTDTAQRSGYGTDREKAEAAQIDQNTETTQRNGKAEMAHE